MNIKSNVGTYDFFDLVHDEMKFGFDRYGNYKNSHELYGVLIEEVDEFFDTVKNNTSDTAHAHYELLQVAAVALRYVMQEGDFEEIMKQQETRHKR